MATDVSSKQKCKSRWSYSEMEEQSVVNEQRTGRPRTASTNRKAESVEELIRADGRVTVEETVINLELGTILCILLPTRTCN